MTLIILINTITGGNKETNSAELNELLSEYFKRISHFIYEFFNSKGLKKEQKHIENIDKMIIRHLRKLVKYYIKQMNKNTKKII